MPGVGSGRSTMYEIQIRKRRFAWLITGFLFIPTLLLAVLEVLDEPLHPMVVVVVRRFDGRELARFKEWTLTDAKFHAAELVQRLETLGDTRFAEDLGLDS